MRNLVTFDESVFGRLKLWFYHKILKRVTYRVRYSSHLAPGFSFRRVK
jgi:hypothetical protein